MIESKILKFPAMEETENRMEFRIVEGSDKMSIGDISI